MSPHLNMPCFVDTHEGLPFSYQKQRKSGWEKREIKGRKWEERKEKELDLGCKINK